MGDTKEVNELKDDLYDDEEEDEDTQKDKFLTFQLGGEDYGLDIRYVTEIIDIQRITEVPDMPEFIKGVINLRGKVIPVMDVRTRFNLPSREYDYRTCIVVVNINETAVGLVVDTVKEVMDIPEAQIEPPPKIKRSESSRFVKGMGKVDDEVKILLDMNKLLYDEELEILQQKGEKT